MNSLILYMYTYDKHIPLLTHNRQTFSYTAIHLNTHQPQRTPQEQTHISHGNNTMSSRPQCHNPILANRPRPPRLTPIHRRITFPLRHSRHRCRLCGRIHCPSYSETANFTVEYFDFGGERGLFRSFGSEWYVPPVGKKKTNYLKNHLHDKKNTLLTSYTYSTLYLQAATSNPTCTTTS